MFQQGVKISSREGAILGLSGTLKCIGTQVLRIALRSKKSITATAGLRQPCAILQTVGVTLHFPMKNPLPLRCRLSSPGEIYYEVVHQTFKMPQYSLCAVILLTYLLTYYIVKCRLSCFF